MNMQINSKLAILNEVGEGFILKAHIRPERVFGLGFCGLVLTPAGSYFLLNPVPSFCRAMNSLSAPSILYTIFCPSALYKYKLLDAISWLFRKRYITFCSRAKAILSIILFIKKII
jgi:hypothetical protein